MQHPVAALPELSPAELQHGAAVDAHVRRCLAEAGGWLSFAAFMQQALYAPGLGYYSAGATRFGPAGDFITAPELSPLFARCLARQLAPLLAQGGDLVEFGAGTGSLAAELLNALAALGIKPKRYRIVEVSAALREQQRQLIGQRAAASLDIVEWLEGPPQQAWQGVALANEVADALPVERFRVTASGCESLGVIATATGFAWEARPATPALASTVARLQQALPQPMAMGYVSELCPWLGPWLQAATASLERGVMLVVDYGLPQGQYYHPSRDGGSLCGFFRHHRVEDVLVRAGLQDLTAWVDFSALAEAGVASGLELLGFSTQAHALAALGIDQELAAAVEGLGPAQHMGWVQGATTLMLPGEMGERFKFLALGREVAGPLAAFSFRDLAASL